MASNVDWSVFVAALSGAHTVVIAGHVRPDGDTVGSALALKRALVSLGKEVLLVNGHNVPPSLAFVAELLCTQRGRRRQKKQQ